MRISSPTLLLATIMCAGCAPSVSSVRDSVAQSSLAPSVLEQEMQQYAQTIPPDWNPISSAYSVGLLFAYPKELNARISTNDEMMQRTYSGSVFAFMADNSAKFPECPITKKCVCSSLEIAVFPKGKDNRALLRDVQFYPVTVADQKGVITKAEKFMPEGGAWKNAYVDYGPYTYMFNEGTCSMVTTPQLPEEMFQNFLSLIRFVDIP